MPFTCKKKKPVNLKRVGLASRVLFEKLEKNTHCFSFSVFLDIQPRPQGLLTGEEVETSRRVSKNSFNLYSGDPWETIYESC